MEIEILVVFFIISFVFQAYWGMKLHGFLLNPITLINIIFFLHNWSFSFVSIFFKDILWAAPDYVNYESQYRVLLINLVSIWLFFIGYLLAFKKIKSYVSLKEYDFLIYKKIYIVLTVIFIVQGIASGAFFNVYGDSQSLTAESAFNPISIILSSRVIFGGVYLIYYRNRKSNRIIILIEILLSILTGGRKSLIILVVCYLLSIYEQRKFSFKKFFKYFVPLIIAVYFIGFVSIYRSYSGSDLSFTQKVSSTHIELTKNVTFLISRPLLAVNSEGVQNWTLQLIESGTLKQTYGLTYLQAIVNTIVLRPFQGSLVDYQAAYYFKYVAYPEISNHGWDFSYSAESILNFGYFAPIVSLFLGILLARIYIQGFKSNYYRIMYLLTIALLFVHFRTDSTALMRMIFFYIAFFAFFRMFRFVKIKQTFSQMSR